MGRFVRVLLKVPAVRRVMARLANAEDAIESADATIRDQQARLTAIATTLTEQDGRLTGLRAGQESDRARSADSAATLSEQSHVIARLSAEQERDRTRSSEQGGVLVRLRADQESDRVRLADMAAALIEQRGMLARLHADQERDRARAEEISAALTDQGSTIAGVNASQDEVRARLTEVAGHMPPAERSQLEMTLRHLQTTLQGQQAQLTALGSAAQANQSELQTLHDVVGQVNRQIADTVKGVEGARELATLELIAAERLRDLHSPERPRVEPYTFEQLLNRQVEPFGPDLVFHVHVPKTAGSTIKAFFQQNKFVALDFDMNTQSFFEVVREDRWLENFRKPPPRARYVLTGHFRLDLPLLRQLRMHHAIATLLRDPIARVLSHYNYTLKVEGNPWRPEILAGSMSFLEYAEWLHAAIGPQYSFFDDTGVGTFARSGTASAERCLDNLMTRVAVFGLTERFDEYCAIAGYLLGRPKVLAVGRDKVTVRIASEHDGSLKMSMSDEERERVGKLFADDIWFYDQACKEYARRVSDPRLQAVLAETLPLMATCEEAMERLAGIRDPANPARGAFDEPSSGDN